jgi:predicted ATPase/DNA-binding CsgD family transcriptional regulator
VDHTEGVVDSPERVCLLSVGGGSRRDGRQAFTSAREAASCALALQRELAGDPVLPRLALHAGGPEDGVHGPAGDVHGPAMSHCDCIRGSASPGQVVLSQQAADLVAGHLPVGCGLSDLGWHRLPDLGPPEHLWQLSHPDLQADFPRLHALQPGRHNLPVQLTSFVGRRDELGKVAGLLADHRLVTLTGSGGCGKTRLALHAAAGRVDGLPDGVWLVELAPLADPGQVAGAIAAALSVRAAGAASDLDRLVAAIGDQALLLVLDNCEHLARRCAEAAERLLLACPRLRLLATSREPLGVPGEVTWRVPSLSFPADAQLSSDKLGRFEAVQLFTERSRRARPGFALTSANARPVAEICGRLDGIPLALELAAARMRVLSAEQIAAGLRDRFRLLTGGSRTAMPRQQTLEASVAWSYHLLDDDERALLRRLSAFLGGFSTQAAEAVGASGTTGESGTTGTTGASGGIGPAQILGLLSQLADKSLIQADDEADGRFGMLETVRHYADRRLVESGEAAATWQRHYEFFLTSAARRPDESAGAYRERLRADYDNIRQALEWAASEDDPGLLLGLAARLGEFWSLSIHLAEARRWLRIAAERGAPADLALRARALGSLAQVASLAADMPTAVEAGTAALDLLRQLNDTDGMIVALTSLGSSATIMGEPDAGRPYLTEAIALAEQTGDQRALAYALALLGRTAVNSAVGRDSGREALQRSLTVARACGARDAESIAIFLLGALDGLDCRPADAIALLRRALPGLRESEDGFFLSFCLAAIAHSEALLGDFAAAGAACDELDAIGDAMGTARLYFSAASRGWLAFCRGQWPEAVSAYREQLSYFASVALRGMWTGSLAWSELLSGDPGTARRRLDDFIRTSDPERTCLALPLAVRALIARADGDHERAEELAHAAVAESPTDAFGRLTVWTCLAVLAAVSADGGGHEVAARLAGAADAFAHAAGLTRPPAAGELIESVAAACRAALGDDRLAEAWTLGQDMTLEDAAAYASRGRGRRRRPATGWAGLTPTELRVAGAVAGGLSNPQIAERMFISRRTVATHLTSIFRKLGVSSRAELAAVAVRREG